MIAPDQVVHEARSWLGTPFHHQARLKGVGVDCVGLIVGVCNALGIPVEDTTNYQRFPNGYLLAKEFERQFIKKFTQPEAGDIMLFRISRMPQHCAICTPIGLIHSHQGVKGVIETSLPSHWRSHLIASFRLPGVQLCN